MTMQDETVCSGYDSSSDTLSSKFSLSLSFDIRSFHLFISSCSSLSPVLSVSAADAGDGGSGVLFASVAAFTQRNNKAH